MDPDGSVDVLVSPDTGPPDELCRSHRAQDVSLLRGRSCKDGDGPSADVDLDVTLWIGVGQTDSITADDGCGEDTPEVEDTGICSISSFSG